jgi:hypothetical protein
MREKSPALIGGVSIEVSFNKSRKDSRSHQTPPIMYCFVKTVADMDMSSSIRGSILKK